MPHDGEGLHEEVMIEKCTGNEIVQGIIRALQKERKDRVEKCVLHACLFAHLTCVEVKRILDSSINGVKELSAASEETISERKSDEIVGPEGFFCCDGQCRRQLNVHNLTEW